MNIKITHRFDSTKILFEGEFDSIKECVLAAIAAGADLRSADLRSADLRSADLSFANLRSADLRSADLRSADLRSADLSSADLRSADLSFADLRSADLRSADLSFADLRFAKIHWQSHALLAHLLFVGAGDDIKHRMIAGLIAVSLDWCWDTFVEVKLPKVQKDWALKELAKWIVDGDEHPEVLDAYREVSI